jgi:hypothetical protein
LVLDDNQRPIHARAADDRFATNWSARCGGIGLLPPPKSDRAPNKDRASGNGRVATGVEATYLPRSGRGYSGFGAPCVAERTAALRVDTVAEG